MWKSKKSRDVVRRSVRPAAMPSCTEPLEARQLCAHFVVGARTFADSNFINAYWQITPSSLGAGGTSSAAQAAKGGHPGKYRVVTDTVYAGGSDSEYLGFHGYARGIYNPAKGGAITFLNYAEDNRLISGFGQGEGTGAALEQNGTVYFALDHSFITPQSTWKHVTATHLTAADFTAINGTDHPDFSQTAAPIQFGFFRENSPGGSAGYTIVAGIDNWSVKLKTRKQIG